MVKRLRLLVLPLVVVCFLLVGCFTVLGQTTEPKLISMSGSGWSLTVDKQPLSVDVKSVASVVDRVGSTDQELTLVLNSLDECKSGEVQFKVDIFGLSVVNQAGGYACFDLSGKRVLQISASKLVDAKGNVCWLDQKLGNGVLTIYLNETWLKSAVFPVVVDPVISYIEGVYKGLSTAGTTITVSVPTPVQNDTLIAVMGGYGGTSITTVFNAPSQEGVSWNKALNSTAVIGSYKMNLEIWYGIVTGVSPSGSIVVSPSTNDYNSFIFDVAEYRGLWLNTSVVDHTAYSSGNGYTSVTGTCAAAVQNDELFVGATYLKYKAQTTPINDFSMYDGSTTSNTYGSLAFLEKIVTVGGSASSGTSNIDSDPWVGAIATFKSVNVELSPTPSPAVTAVATPTSGFGLDMNWLVFAFVVFGAVLCVIPARIFVVRVVVGMFGIVLAVTQLQNSALWFYPWSLVLWLFMSVCVLYSIWARTD